ncbi:hypothetical protein, partial [Ruminococcus sp.]|uniref:hypothetical protein n=1 Tax=Ruminococcus sp. TaxID=41978 RepID=UPI002E802A50
SPFVLCEMSRYMLLSVIFIPPYVFNKIYDGLAQIITVDLKLTLTNEKFHFHIDKCIILV